MQRSKKQIRQRKEKCPYRNLDNNDNFEVINLEPDNEVITDEEEEWEKIFGDGDPLLEDNTVTDKDISKTEKAKTVIDKLLEWGDKGASIFSKLKGGVVAYDSGDKYEIYPEDKENAKADKMMRNWIIGIVVLVLLSITVLVFANRRKKNNES